MDTNVRLLRCIVKEFEKESLTVGNIYEGYEYLDRHRYYKIKDDAGRTEICKFAWKFEEVSYPDQRSAQPEADLSREVEAAENGKFIEVANDMNLGELGCAIGRHASEVQPSLPGVDLSVGTKADSGKAPLSLIPRSAVEAEARVLAFGANKYQAHNWRKGMAWSRLIDAAMRHLQAIADGEDCDPETGELHAAHLRCCSGFLIEYMTHNIGNDDRYKRNDI